MKTNKADELLTLNGVRKSCQDLFAWMKSGQGHWTFNEDKVEFATRIVIDDIKNRYGDFSNIPGHSRWNHFKGDKFDRTNNFWKSALKLEQKTAFMDAVDLIIISVLLDAGAGDQWKYQDSKQGISLGRSEGLGLASFDMLASGLFSSTKNNPFHAHAKTLISLNVEELNGGFQVNSKNPLVGLEGRCALLNRLGKTLYSVFEDEHARPSFLFSDLIQHSSVDMNQIFERLVRFLNKIWEDRPLMSNEPMGDCWPHQGSGSWVAFHKLTQWLSYSLIDIFKELNISVVNAKDLTGLPEYRNGGLFIDTGVLVAKKPLSALASPSDDLILEWRAATVCLLEEVYKRILKHYPQEKISMAMVLEGGTWWAGRMLAKEKRAGLPPLNINSDGTVF